MATATLVETVGGASANTYATLAEADQYHDNRPDSGTTWDDASNASKNEALLWAAKLLDALWDWNGNVINETQAMLWPRMGLYYRNGYYIPSTVIPDDLKDAQAEFARQLLVEDRAADSDVETQGLESLRAGPVTLDFKASVSAKVVPDLVANLIPRDWGIPRGRKRGTRRAVRA